MAANPAKKYDKTADKSNINSGIVGIWDKTMKGEGQVFTTRVCSIKTGPAAIASEVKRQITQYLQLTKNTLKIANY